MGFKKKIRFIHKWLGLTSGLIVFIVSITGCIYCFHDEIKDMTREWRTVEAEAKPYIAPSVLQKKAKELYPDVIQSMVIYGGEARPAFVYGVKGEDGYFIYFNPYSGKFMHAENLEEDFFHIVEHIHLYLLLPPEIGKHIVGVATIIFIFLLITGIIQWWPKKKKQLKDRLQVKWSAKWRRVNYDWHNVSGFYISIVALVIAATGLTFTYEWMGDAMYYGGNLGRNYPEERAEPVIDTTLTQKDAQNVMDKAFAQTLKLAPTRGMYFVWDQGPKNAIIAGSYPNALEYHHQSNLQFHPVTGELVKELMYDDKSAGMKLQEMNYGLHTGQYFGLTGKIIVFIASLIAAALPVTGIVIWWGRRNKKPKHVKIKKAVN
ncbi:PepSY domain-containing protein [Flavobacterium sp. MFBS3-15]|uniref:PepSY-associated TM helix domain-containing protein n=1 Tax=Flavobacterium sp. MFBS3-15 TaxID=2989816 RepID=UPI0022362823|nr:PepSY-associated TM helix domain-containing protein [Flavobacterium sp. MFBS3-15]MCW4469727.1 PepSY domain-containing protein [Flavobacterium sp. MFBS3-15]